MRRALVVVSSWLVAGLAGLSPAAGPTTRSGTIAAGTRWATAWHLVDSGKPGPTVLVAAGVHGDEPAGVLAAEEVRCWPITKGKLLIVPRCNVPGLAARPRTLPDMPDEQAHLNRNFPSGKRAAPVGEPAKSLWAFVSRHRPSYVLVLHEGTGFRAAGPESVGSSVIRSLHPAAAGLQQRMLDAANAEIFDAGKRFVALKRPAEGSLGRAAHEQLGACSFFCETTMADQPVALRVRQHRLMVHALLTELGMAAGPAIRATPAGVRRPGSLHVARYNGQGAGYNTVPDRFEEAFAGEKDVLLRRVGPEDLRDGVLDQFDVVLFPGGSGSGQSAGLGEAGRELVRRFVERGGGYVGICGGAYLATASYPWSLKIIDARSIDSKHWRRGKGDVELGVTEIGRRLLGCEKAEVGCRFAQGPILAPAGRDDLADYTVLAWFRTGIGKNGADPQTMVDTPAIVTGTFGKGRVVVISPHPEATPSLGHWLPRAARWAAAREPNDVSEPTGDRQ